MSYLIIPDVHNHVDNVEKLIEMFPDRHPIFLGDYFDDYNDDAAAARYTAKWLAWSVQKGRTHLMGNHDLPYRWRSLRCPGWTISKHKAACEYMTADDWSKVLFTFSLRSEDDKLRPMLLSHAGVSMPNLYGIEEFEFYRGGRFRHLMQRSARDHLKEVFVCNTDCLAVAERHGSHENHHWLHLGRRCGLKEIAGPFWQDESEFHLPLRGIDQIVGHSRMLEPEMRSWPNAKESQADTWFIDCGGRAAALVDAEDNGRGGMRVTPIRANGKGVGTPYDDNDL